MVEKLTDVEKVEVGYYLAWRGAIAKVLTKPYWRVKDKEYFMEVEIFEDDVWDNHPRGYRTAWAIHDNNYEDLKIYENEQDVMLEVL